jgi:D-amino-acid dehydrogenase
MKQKEQPSNAQIKVRQLNNVEQINISKHEIHDLEPSLSDQIKGGWYFPKACHTLNPDKILKKLFNKFIEKNGLFIKQRVSSLNNEGKKFNINSQNYDDLVICCGAFSKELVKHIEGKTIPLETERGYHVEYLGMQEFLSRPTCLVESGMYLSPLEYGIRAAGTVELAGIKDEINQSRINFINNNARKLIPKLQDYQNTWLGYRPTLPDCLPIISKSPKFDNLFYAFGHNHLGWTLGPITGKIVTGLINKDKFDHQALEMNRFIK